MIDKFLQITTTTQSEDQAEQIAAKLIELRFAACVQIDGPIESHYRWDASVRCDREWRLSIKTVVSRYADVEALLTQIHSYDQPEIIATPIVAGASGYLKWLEEQSE